MSVNFFDLTRQNKKVWPELLSALESVALSGRYILGENVSSLEAELATLCGAKHAVGVASGTDALHLALRAAGVGPGDEVITSPFTFVATAEAICYCGATPVFADIEPNTFNIDGARAAGRVTRKTKAILPVHLYGQVCNMDILAFLCQKEKIKLVEDCAQSIGSLFKDKHCGSFGGAGCFSFFPTKNLGGFGDGGAVVTNSDQLADEVRVLRGHGSRVTYHYDLIGYNSRLDELQAAIIRVKLPHLSEYADTRRRNAQLYVSQLSGLGQVVLPKSTPGAYHVYNQFTIRVKERDDLFGFLKSKAIGAMVYYPLSLHLQKAFAYLGYKKGDFPESEKAQDEVLSLPIYPELTEKEILEVCSAIKEFYAKR